MFEKVVSNFLTRLLGKYVDGLNGETLSIAVWSGEVELENLELKKEALDLINIPFDIVGGVIGKLHLSLPWRNLLHAPTVLRLSDLHVIVGPRKQQKWDKEYEDERVQKKKQKKLKKLEKIKQQKRKIEEEGNEETSDTLTDRIVTKMIENVQIFIDNIHVRYEDDRNPNSPFACGLTIQSAAARSTDASFLVTDGIVSADKVIYKMISLVNCSVYWNHNDKPIRFKSKEDLWNTMDEMIFRKGEERPDNNNYIIEPVCGELRVKVRKSRIPDAVEPKLTLDFLFESITGVLSEIQFEQCIHMMEWLSKHSIRERYRIFRPFDRTVQGDPMAYWKFVLQSKFRERRKKQSGWSFAALGKRRKYRLEYMELWKEHLKTKKKNVRLDEMETFLTVDDIGYFRSLAETKVPQSLLPGKKKEKKGWWGWGASTVTEELDAFGLHDYGLSEKERALFYKAIDYSESEEDTSTSFFDPSYVNYRVSFKLKKFGAKLVGHEDEQYSIAEGTLDELIVRADIRSGSSSISASIGSILIMDHLTPNPTLPIIAQPVAKLLQQETDVPFFALNLDINPLHSSDDIYLKVRLQGSDIVVNLKWIMGIVRLFKRPFQKKETGQVEKKIGKQMSAIKTNGVLQVAHILRAHKQIALDFEICAPRIIIPEDHLPTAPILIVDLGKLKVTTLAKERVTEVPADFFENGQNKSHHFLDHLYDEFVLEATSLELLLINAKDWPLLPSPEHPASIQILQKFDASLSLGILMVAASDELTKIRVSGYTPGIFFVLTASQVRDLLRVGMSLAEDEGPGAPLPELVPIFDEMDEPELGVGQEILEGVKEVVVEAPIFTPNQKRIECHFSIADGWLRVVREEKNDTLVPIAEMHVRGLVVQYMFRALDQIAFVGVHSVEIKDLMQTYGEDYQFLATSHPIEGQAGYEYIKHRQPHQGDLINIVYTKTKKKSPYYAALDNQVDLAFQEVYFMFNRETVAALNEFINIAFLSDGTRRTARRIARLEKFGALPEYITTEKDTDGHNGVKLQPPAAVLVKVTVTLAFVHVLLNSEATGFALCEIDQLAVGVLYHESIMDIKGTLHSILLEDISPKVQYYPQLLSIDGQDMVTFMYKQFNPEFADYPGYKQMLRLKVNSVNVTLLQRFFFELSDFFGEMSQMKKIMADTASLAVARAQNEESLSNEQKYERKFRFEIVLEDLKLNIPKNSISPEFIQLDMGKISLANSHYLIDDKKYIIGERMSFLMSDAHAEAGNALHPEALTQIIENIDLLMEWERSIDDEDHSVPGFSLIVDVPHIKFKMTEKQYGLWMNTIRQMITERSLQSQRRSILNGTDLPQVPVTKQEACSEENQKENEQEPWVTVAVALNFHHGDVEILEENAETGERESQAIGKLKEFAFMWISSSDGQMKMHFSFDDITVIDSRKEKTQFSNMWYHEHIGDQPIFNFYFTNNGKGNSRISFQFDRPRMVMLPLVHKVIKYFGTNPYICYDLPPALLASINEGLPAEKQLPRIDPNLQTGASVSHRVYEGLTIASLFHSSEPPGFSMNFKMIDVVIKLPTEPQNENSSGIILHGNLVLKYNSTDPISGYRIMLDNWQMNRCLLSQEEETMTRIIKPFSGSISYFNTPMRSDASIHVDPIFVSFSYRDFKSIMAIASCLVPPTSPVIDDEDTIQREEIKQKQAEAQRSAQQQNMDVFLGGLKVNLIDDLNGSNIPLLNAWLYGVIFHMDNWSTALSLSLQCQCQSEYYNRVNTCMEPLIEPWSFSCKFSRFPLPQTNNLYYSKGIIESKHILNGNITKVCSDTFQNTVTSWTEDYLSKKDELAVYDDSVQNVSIRNETGVAVSYWQGSYINARQIEHGDCILLQSHTQQFGSEFSDREAQIEKQNQKESITIQLEGGWQPIDYLPISRIGSWSVGLRPKPYSGAVRIIWSVENNSGNKERTITIRSNVALKNTTNTDINIQIRISGRGSAPVETIAAQSTYFIPLQYAASGKIFVRPVDGKSQMNWSSNFIDCSVISHQKKKTLQCTSQRDEAWFCCFCPDKKEVGGRTTFLLSAPVEIENALPSDIQYSIRRKEKDGKHTAFPLVSSVLEVGCTLQFFQLPYKQAEICFTFKNYTGQFVRLENIGTLEISVKDQQNRKLVLYLDNNHSSTDAGTVSALYANYWMVNKTGLPLFYMRKGLNGNDPAPGQQDTACKPLGHDPSTWYDESNRSLSKPYVYSYCTTDIFRNRTAVQVATSKWSKPFSIESVGTDGNITVPDSKSKMQFGLGVTIELNRGRYHRSKIITFRPRYILVNRMQRDICYRQVKTKFGLLLPPGKSLPFHWVDREKPLELCLAFSPNHKWSTEFAIDNLSEFAVKLKELDTCEKSTYLARVEVQMNQGTIFVIFKTEAVDIAPYSIENNTSLDLQYGQKLSKFPMEKIKANSTVPYTWDYHLNPHKLIVELPNHQSMQGSYNLDKIKQYAPISFMVGDTLYRIVGSVIANGPTRTLRLCDVQYHPDQAVQTEEIEQEVDKEAETTMTIIFKLAGCGISIINDKPEELLYMSIRGLSMDYSNSSKQMRLELLVSSLQIDNQIPFTSFPVLLCRTPGKGDEGMDFFHLSLIKSNYYTSIDYFHYFSFLLQELDLHIDDTIINELLQFFDLQFDHASVNTLVELEQDLALTEPTATAKKIYFVLFHANPIKCNVTFCLAAQTGDGDSEEDAEMFGIYNHVQSILNAIGVTLANIEDAPISLRSLMLENSFLTRSEMSSRILKHYYRQLLYEMYKVVGSFDVIGNPVSLVSNLGTGVYDFFYEPASGLVQSPKGFVLGVGKGSSSLVKNSVVGIFGTASKITGTIGKGVAHLAFDKSYLLSREKHTREKPKHIGEGMVWGAKELTTGLRKGFTGIITSPLDGAKKEGVGGFAKGMGKGVIGLAVKPGVGLFDMATRTTQGIKNSAIHNEAIVKKRPPRRFGPDRVLHVYNIENAIGQSILHRINDGAYLKEWHLFHCVGKNDRIVLVSNKHLFSVGVKPHIYVIWSCSLFDIEKATAKDAGIHIQLASKTSSSIFSFAFQSLEAPPSQLFELSMTNTTATWLKSKLDKTIALIHRFDQDDDNLAFSSGLLL